MERKQERLQAKKVANAEPLVTTTTMGDIPYKTVFIVNKEDQTTNSLADLEGKTWHKFLRSDDLNLLSENDLRFLADYGVGTVIDLRSERELTEAPHPEASTFHYHNFPLSSDNAVELPSFEDFTFSQFYTQILINKQAELREIFSILAKKEQGVLFHCAAGKDRTGVMAALILGSVGVSAQDIVANYQTTHTYLIQNPLFGEASQLHAALLRSDAEAMQETLVYLFDNYGDIPTYLKEIGVTDEELARLQQKFSVSSVSV